MAKIGKRVLGAAGVGILVSSLGVLAACGSAQDENTGASAQAVSNANVSLVLLDENGVKVGEGSGILIAPRTVLTAAHLVAGKGKWTVTSADGKTKVNGVRGQTFDWRRYDSLMAHPRKHDVAVVFLDRPINLPSYPKVATTSMPNGEQVMRVRGNGSSFELISSKLDRVRQMPNAYVTSMPASETLDTGGAVLNSKGEIVGVVTGRGMQTGKLYIAKIGEVVGWLSDKAVCGGSKVGSLTTKTYGTPTPKDGCTKDGGAGTSSSSGGYGSSSGGSSSGSSSGGSSSGGSSGSSGGSSGSSGGDDSSTGQCTPGGGFEYPGGGGSPGTETEGTGSNTGSENGSVPGGSSGSSGTGTSSGGSSSGSTGSSGSSGTGTSGGTNTGGETGTVPGGSSGSSGTGTSSGGSSSGTAGSSGAGSSGGSNTGSESGTVPGGGGGAGGSAGADEEVCEGENDNPDVCPPETTTCEGANCGGATSPADNTIDYGNCGCGGSSGGSGGPIILR